MAWKGLLLVVVNKKLLLLSRGITQEPPTPPETAILSVKPTQAARSQHLCQGGAEVEREELGGEPQHVCGKRVEWVLATGLEAVLRPVDAVGAEVGNRVGNSLLTAVVGTRAC